LVAVGAGGGDASGFTVRVGSGAGGAFGFVFAFSFVVGDGLTSSVGSAEGSKLASGLGLAITGGLIVPPEGIPCSLLPVGEDPGCTG
jgi:hypothetical protein